MTNTTRRSALGAAAALLASPALAAAPRQPQHRVPYSAGTNAPRLRVPAFATDCHFHIYNDRFPPAPGGLPAPNASPADYRKLQARIGTTRGVIVQPSLYGVDNRATLDGIKELGGNFRGVGVVNDKVTDAELQALHEGGIRGIRFNLAQVGATSPEMVEPLAARVSRMGWHLQFNLPAAKLLDLKDLFLRVNATMVFDHLAHVPHPDGVNHASFALVKQLLEKGNTWVKLSGAYADTKVGAPSYSDSSAVARAFAQIRPDRMVWGSDWPHPTERADNKPNDATLLDLLENWVPDAGKRHAVLVDNPARLYDFPRT